MVALAIDNPVKAFCDADMSMSDDDEFMEFMLMDIPSHTLATA